jgi:hypothetical protein
MFWDSQGVLLASFHKCGENVNSASHCEVLLKLQDAICRERAGQLATGVWLYHDNARPHTAQATQERIQELHWELLEHLPYIPDLAPSDVPPFGLLKKPPWWQTFCDDKEIETKAWKWLRQQSKDFYAMGFDTMVKQWNIVSMLMEDMSRNNCF